MSIGYSNIYFSNSQDMSEICDNQIDLVVTSPPYPMIYMWNDMFIKQNPNISLDNPKEAFELMHQELDKVWKECYRVLKEGSFMCINIGDAARRFNDDFQLFSNSARITQACEKIGFTSLPPIIWRKPTNSPNKFMGSGMLPCGAYVTLEHEYILIFRKGSKKEYITNVEKRFRRESAYFWEERNKWFSDIWEVNGIKQKMNDADTRKRSGAFPLEIPYRLINMFSLKNDIVLDPFIGLGTTAAASLICGRSSVGYEIDKTLKPSIKNTFDNLDVENLNNKFIKDRINNHIKFINDRINSGKTVKYFNNNLQCKVITSQETDIKFEQINKISLVNNVDTLLTYKTEYI